jgi:hypothetical protein
VLSAAAIRLVLELQLLAASAAQRLQQQQDLQQLKKPKDVTILLSTSNGLLHAMIRAFLQANSSSCLPPEVLQQAGLQLLQALSAPIQQLQLSAADGPLPGVVGHQDVINEGALEHQLYLLRAAVAGLASPQQQHVVSGEP